MGFIEKLDFFFGIAGFFSCWLSIYMVYYLSQYHMKVMDQIIHHQKFIDDNFISKAMRIATYQVNIFVKRNRELLPLDTQKKILSLDKKFRRPFLILIWNQFFLIVCILVMVILEEFFSVDWYSNR